MPDWVSSTRWASFISYLEIVHFLEERTGEVPLLEAPMLLARGEIK